MASSIVLIKALLVAAALNGLNAFGIDTGLFVGANVGVTVGPVGRVVGVIVGGGMEGEAVGPVVVVGASVRSAVGTTTEINQNE